MCDWSQNQSGQKIEWNKYQRIIFKNFSFGERNEFTYSSNTPNSEQDK